MKVGILGGTFNPPHIGHLVLARETLEALKLDKVFFIPTNTPPHKVNDNISANHRYAMVKLAIIGEPCFEVLDIEIERKGVSFTVDTVKQLRKKYPGYEFFLVAGSELARDFAEWKDFETIKKNVKIVVAQREICPLDKTDGFIELKISQIGISSSQIRKLLQQGKSAKYFVRDNVLDYINKHKLYM
ncbi:MAG: nicotinate-nucleotide adenylyltransferase [Candidatus Omnitrophota bacterium]